MIFRTNYHSHNVFCDGRASMETFVQFAIAKGLKQYGFSSHSPLPFHTSWNMDLDNLPYYKQEFKRLKNKYLKDIDLKIGLEMDYIPDFFGATNNNLYQTDDLDYMIGSVHYLDKLPSGSFFSIDGNFYDFQKGVDLLYDGDIKALTNRFFGAVRDMIEEGGFNIVGHMDKISLNGRNYKEFDIQDKQYIQNISEILQLIKNKGIILEINTKSFLEKGLTYPDIRFFPLISELKIPIVVSSDCHYPDKICDGFEPVYKILKEAKLNELMELKGKIWNTAPLPF
ncbi:MAG: histidinol-phosphatase [Paludibacteraceae bacterium]